MNTRVLNDKANSLVNTSAQDLQSGLWQYKTDEDLAVLRIGYIICRRRKEKTKSRILASKIQKLDITLRMGGRAVKPKRPYIVIRCAVCRNQTGQGKGKMAAISNAREQGARIVPIIKDGQRKKTVICGSCFQKNPTVELYGIVKESSHGSSRSS